jgi:hypothetical protein
LVGRQKNLTFQLTTPVHDNVAIAWMISALKSLNWSFMVSESEVKAQTLVCVDL